MTEKIFHAILTIKAENYSPTTLKSTLYFTLAMALHMQWSLAHAMQRTIIETRLFVPKIGSDNKDFLSLPPPKYPINTFFIRGGKEVFGKAWEIERNLTTTYDTECPKNA